MNRHYTKQNHIKCSLCVTVKYYTSFCHSIKMCKECINEIAERKAAGLPYRVCICCRKFRYPSNFGLKKRKCKYCTGASLIGEPMSKKDKDTLRNLFKKDQDSLQE